MMQPKTNNNKQTMIIRSLVIPFYSEDSISRTFGGLQNLIEIKTRLTAECTSFQCLDKNISGWEIVQFVGLLHFQRKSFNKSDACRCQSSFMMDKEDEEIGSLLYRQECEYLPSFMQYDGKRADRAVE